MLPLNHSSQVCYQKNLSLSYASKGKKNQKLKSFGFVPVDGNGCIFLPHPSYSGVRLQVLVHSEVWPERVLLWAASQVSWNALP